MKFNHQCLQRQAFCILYTWPSWFHTMWKHFVTYESRWEGVISVVPVGYVVSALLFEFPIQWSPEPLSIHSCQSWSVQRHGREVPHLPCWENICCEGWKVVFWIRGGHCWRHASWLEQARVSTWSGAWLRWTCLCFWWLQGEYALLGARHWSL